MFSSDLSYKHVLCPVDFSETGRAAFYRAVAYCRTFGAKLTILHIREGVDDDPDDASDETHPAMYRLEAGLVQRLNDLEEDGFVNREERSRITSEIRSGKPWFEILKFADEADIDLIVIGTHGRTGFKHLFMGSQAERVVRHSCCDVTTVKPEGWESSMDFA